MAAHPTGTARQIATALTIRLRLGIKK